MEPSRNWISKALMTVVLVVIVDQISKVIVLKTMARGQSIDVFGDWLKLTYTENPGMAFGLEFGPPAMIAIFSVIATVLIVIYLFKVGGIFTPYRVSLSFVLGGAIGNIIDRVFYGKIVYGEPLFLGRVVDFIHVNVWRGIVPEAVPFLGGKYLALFPIWNVADMAIVCGVVGIMWYQKSFHLKIQNMQEAAAASAVAADSGADAHEAGSEMASTAALDSTTDAPEPGVEDPGSPGESSSDGNDAGKQQSV